MRTTRKIIAMLAIAIPVGWALGAGLAHFVPPDHTARADVVAKAAAGTTCDARHPLNCRRAVAYWKHRHDRAEAAVMWQKRARLHEAERVGELLLSPYARAVAAARLAEATCIAYLGPNHDCPPPAETLLIARCESGIQEHDPNPASTADGPHQYLDSTWAGTGFGMFSRTDMLPSFLAIELFGANHHRTYSPWAASRGCHHLR